MTDQLEQWNNELLALIHEDDVERENLKNQIMLTKYEWLPDGKLEITTSIDDHHTKIGIDWLKWSAPIHQRKLESHKKRWERMQELQTLICGDET